jgi:hypothetical protein
VQKQPAVPGEDAAVREVPVHTVVVAQPLLGNNVDVVAEAELATTQVVQLAVSQRTVLLQGPV